MKKIIFILLLTIHVVNIYSQTPIGALIYGTTTYPKFIVFDERLPRGNDAQSILLANLKLNADAHYTLTQQITDKLGRRHEKYQQQYKGLRVNTGTYVVHYNLDGTIGAINGNYYPIDQFNVTPTFSETEALNKALTTVGAKEYAWQNPQMEQWLRTTQKDSAATFYPTGELLVYPIMDSLDSITYQLAYQYNIVASQPFNSEIVVVNALTGSVLNQYTTFSSAFGDACTRYSGTVAIETTLNTTSNNYELHDQSNGRNIVTRNAKVLGSITNNNTTEFKDANNLVSPNDWTCAEWMNIDNDYYALDAHWAGMMIYDYFKQVHNRDSYDGQGSVLDIYVHYSGANGFLSAEWLGVTIGTVFGIGLGDGNGTQFDALVNLDIVAHEFGHGLTQTSSGLSPSSTSGNNESAAINEGLSDIWGAAVEDWVISNGSNGAGDTDKDPWLAGEEIRLGFVAERSLRDPKSFTVATRMADTYGGVNYNSGLRGRSGVMSHWFYLLSEGSAATDGVNDNGFVFDDGLTIGINGIGIAKAADIVYLAQTVYFTELTDYKDARQATLQAAKDLYGSCSGEVQTVVAAWDAVGVGAPPYVVSYGTLACGNLTTGIYDGTVSNIEIAAEIPPNGIIISDQSPSICNHPVTVPSGATVVFKASSQILLGPGFKAEHGSTFKAYIFQCSGAGNYRVGGGGNLPVNSVNNLGRTSSDNSIFILYPNPTTGQFTIRLENVGKSSLIEIYDIMGKKVWSKNAEKNKLQIDISNQPKGIYMVKVVNGNTVTTQKIVYQ